MQADSQPPPRPPQKRNRWTVGSPLRMGIVARLVVCGGATALEILTQPHSPSSGALVGLIYFWAIWPRDADGRCWRPPYY